MFISYFKIGLRNLSKNKSYSIINIGGLAIGMTVAILIGLWIYDELSFNKSHANYDRIAKVIQHVSNNGEIQTVSNVPYPLAQELRKNYGDDFKQIVLAKEGDWKLLTYGDKSITKPGAFFEPNAVAMLSLKMLYGTNECLKDPSSIVLSQSTAKIFFGDTNPINQLIKLDNKIDVKVTGVFEDLPYNSDFNKLTFIAPWDLYFNNTEWVRTAADPWRPNAFQVYVELEENADLEKVSFKIKDAKLKNVNSELAKKKPVIFLHAMSKWHLFSDFKNGFNTGGRIQYVWLFGTIGVFVLLLACINFMNLSTARSQKRAKEIGIRKAIGSNRGLLIRQFFCESLLVAMFSFVLSLLLVQLILPFFNEVADKKILIAWSSPLLWCAGIAFSLFTGLIAGTYPALYLSSFQPLKVLKGTFQVGRYALIPRKVLVVIQFTVSITLIIGTIVVYRQIQFAQDRPIGYNINRLVVLPQISDEIHNHFDVVKDELIKRRVVTGMAEATNPTTEIWSTTSGFDWTNKDPNMSTDIPFVGVSYDYGEVIGWRVKAGRDFSHEFVSDSSAVILNETAIRFMGLENPIGEIIKLFDKPLKIIGVVNDMVIQSPYEQVRPLVYYISKDTENFIIAKINPAAHVTEALAGIEAVFKKYNPSAPFDYQFADEEYAKKFGNEKRISTLSTFFAVLAILISCLGLFGLVSFLAEQRTKEIGVRKILGASITHLWGLLSKEFLVLALVSLLVASPLAFYFMNGWVQKYAYHIEISWWIFAVSGLGILLVTLLTVSIQSIKTALANPVKSLRSE